MPGDRHPDDDTLIETPDGRRIGLLGGSFNPAHQGHLHVSRLAIARLGLDEVWWLVSPQNPLKPIEDMAPFDDRFAAARTLAAADTRVHVSDAERRLGTRYTADTLRALARRFPEARFVWIMGADNLIQIDQWDEWSTIFHTVAIAVFARAPYSSKALSSTAARRFADARIDESESARLADKPPPAWVFLHTPLHPESATRIRSRQPARDDGNG